MRKVARVLVDFAVRLPGYFSAREYEAEQWPSPERIERLGGTFVCAHRWTHF